MMTLVEWEQADNGPPLTPSQRVDKVLARIYGHLQAVQELAAHPQNAYIMEATYPVEVDIFAEARATRFAFLMRLRRRRAEESAAFKRHRFRRLMQIRHRRMS